MWQVDNRTPFAAERGWVRDRDGAEVWVVGVKCTFDVKPDGSTEASPDQPPVLRAAEYNGEPGKSSIRYDADLVLTKNTTDVIVVGHAYAPNGRPVSECDVGISVGPVRKVLHVVGDRVWDGAAPGPPSPFLKMPLVYERAFGGADTKSANAARDFDWRNPVGTGFAVNRSHLLDVAMPNVEYGDRNFGSWNDRPPPAGFGAIAGHWQPRVGFAGTYDDKWMKERLPLLPTDFDDRYFQCAPPDQQTPAFLRGGEPAALLNLTPDGRLNFVLPRIFLGFETFFYTGERTLHQTRQLHTVIIEPDFPRVSLVWHTALPCHFMVQKLERTVVTMKTPIGNRPETDLGEADFDEPDESA